MKSLDVRLPVHLWLDQKNVLSGVVRDAVLAANWVDQACDRPLGGRCAAPQSSPKRLSISLDDAWRLQLADDLHASGPISFLIHYSLLNEKTIAAIHTLIDELVEKARASLGSKIPANQTLLLAETSSFHVESGEQADSHSTLEKFPEWSRKWYSGQQ